MTKPKFITDSGIDFYVKWIATIIGLIHVYLTAHDIAPYFKYTGLIVSLLWLWVGILWRQLNVIILNSVIAIIYIQGLLNL